MSYSFPTDATDGDVVSLDNGVRYEYQADKDRWMVKEVINLGECPRFEAVALQYKDYNNPKEQLIISYFPNGAQDGALNVGWSEVRLANFLQELDPNKDWISIDGNRHQIHSVGELGGDPIYQMMTGEGDLTGYIGSTVEVHNCDGQEEYATLEHSDGRDDALQIQIDELEQEIDIIAPRLDGAQYTYASSYAVKAGEMFIASNSFTAATDVVFFNDVALDGTTHAWGSLNEGDYLEITDTQERSGRTAENYAMYLCTGEPEGTGLKQIEVALVKGSGAPTVGDVLDAKGFELGGNDINDLDSRYDLKQSHLSLYRSMKLESKSYNDPNYNQITPKSNTLIMSGQGFNTSQAIIMRDLDSFYPPDKYEFVPGMVTAMEPYISSGASWEIEQPAAVWVWWAYEVKEWAETRQRIQGTPLWFGNAKNNGKYPSSEFTYQINFQCFRRK